MTDLQKDEVLNSVTTLLALVLATNGYEIRKRPYTGTLPTVFFEYSGHVNTLYLRIYKDGWQSGEDYDRAWDINLNKPIPGKTLDSIAEYCTSCLEEKKESEIVFRDISRLEEKILEEKETLKHLRKKYRKLEKEGR